MEYIFQFSKLKKIIFQIFLLFILLVQSNAFAGPPFLTDDPIPVAYQNWALYFFSRVDDSPDITNIKAPAIEIDYGAIPNLELHMIVPGTASIPNDNEANNYGLGDIDVGFKYRFIQETDDQPQVAIYPIFKLPTGDADRGLGNGRLWVKLPIWLQKSWGSWTSYGGGGCVLNSAANTSNYPFAGWVLQHNFNQRLTLGGELFSQGRSAYNVPSFTILNVGGNYNFTPHFSLLFTGGHSVTGQRNTTGYLGLYWTGAI